MVRREEVDDNLSTLMDFRYKRKYVAETGADGQGKRKSGLPSAQVRWRAVMPWYRATGRTMRQAAWA